MKISDKIVRLFKERFGIDFPETEKPRRLYPGYFQRASGAWSWVIGGTLNYNASYGSQWSMGDILKAEFVTLYLEPGGDVSLLPVSKDEYIDWLKNDAGIWKDKLEIKK